MNVYNGERVEVVASDYVGVAGYNRIRGKAQLCYEPNKTPKLKVGDTITVAGSIRTVERIEASEYLAGFRVVTLS